MRTLALAVVLLLLPSSMAFAAEKKQPRSKIADAISSHSSGRNSGRLGKVPRKHRPKSYKAPKYKFPKNGVKR